MTDVKVLDLAAWVEQAPTEYKDFREAVHLILQGVGQSKELHAKMIMKGVSFTGAGNVPAAT